MLCNGLPNAERKTLGKGIRQIIQDSRDKNWICYLYKGKNAIYNFNLATKLSSILIFKVGNCLAIMFSVP